MKHHKNFRKFGREKNARHSFIKGLAINLVRHDKIETTVARAKEIRPFVERLVTLAKIDSISRRRLVSSRIFHIVFFTVYTQCSLIRIFFIKDSWE